MPLSSLVLFAGFYAIAVASPGPGIAALVARVLARGTRGIAAFVAGILVGDLIWFAVSATGFALVAQTFAAAFVVLKYAGAAYLAYLAWRTWSAQIKDTDPETIEGVTSPRLFLGGLALTLSNPKAILFFLALLPSVVDLDHVGALGFMEMAAIIVIVMSTVLTAYTVAAARARRLFTSPRARRAINRGAGATMACAAVAIAAR